MSSKPSSIKVSFIEAGKLCPTPMLAILSSLTSKFSSITRKSTTLLYG